MKVNSRFRERSDFNLTSLPLITLSNLPEFAKNIESNYLILLRSDKLQIYVDFGVGKG